MKKSKMIAAALAASMVISSLGVLSASAEGATFNYVTINGNEIPTYMTNCTGEEFVKKIQQQSADVCGEGFLDDMLMWEFDSDISHDDLTQPHNMNPHALTYTNP